MYILVLSITLSCIKFHAWEDCFYCILIAGYHVCQCAAPISDMHQFLKTFPIYYLYTNLSMQQLILLKCMSSTAIKFFIISLSSVAISNF